MYFTKNNLQGREISEIFGELNDFCRLNKMISKILRIAYIKLVFMIFCEIFLVIINH